MTRYHIAKSGKPARCQAKTDAACPLGGRHFGSKDEADFYAELSPQERSVNDAMQRMTEVGPKIVEAEVVVPEPEPPLREDMVMIQGKLLREEPLSEAELQVMAFQSYHASFDPRFAEHVDIYADIVEDFNSQYISTFDLPNGDRYEMTFWLGHDDEDLYEIEQPKRRLTSAELIALDAPTEAELREVEGRIATFDHTARFEIANDSQRFHALTESKDENGWRRGVQNSLRGVLLDHAESDWDEEDESLIDGQRVIEELQERHAKATDWAEREAYKDAIRLIKADGRHNDLGDLVADKAVVVYHMQRLHAAGS